MSVCVLYLHHRITMHDQKSDASLGMKHQSSIEYEELIKWLWLCSSTCRKLRSINWMHVSVPMIPLTNVWNIDFISLRCVFHANDTVLFKKVSNGWKIPLIALQCTTVIIITQFEFHSNAVDSEENHVSSMNSIFWTATTRRKIWSTRVSIIGLSFFEGLKPLVFISNRILYKTSFYETIAFDMISIGMKHNTWKNSIIRLNTIFVFIFINTHKVHKFYCQLKFAFVRIMISTAQFFKFTHEMWILESCVSWISWITFNP